MQNFEFSVHFGLKAKLVSQRVMVNLYLMCLARRMHWRKFSWTKDFLCLAVYTNLLVFCTFWKSILCYFKLSCIEMSSKQTGKLHCLVEWTNVFGMWDVLPPTDVKWVVPFNNESGDPLIKANHVFDMVWNTHGEADKALVRKISGKIF